MLLNECGARMAPKLVRLYDSQNFYAHSGKGKMCARTDLADAVVDLLDTALTAREKELVSDILIAFMRKAEDDLRAALAQRLSLLDHVPLRVILHLANDRISVARSVLEKSSVLSDMDLIYIIKSQGSGHWEAIARRKSMGADLIDCLAVTRDVGTACVLAANQNIVLTGKAMETLCGLSQESGALAAFMAERSELPRSLAVTLYTYVGQALRDRIVARYALNPETLAQIDEVLEEVAEGQGASAARKKGWEPTQAMMTAAVRMAGQGTLTPSSMIETLKRGQISSFIAQFAAFAEVHPRVIEAILRQSNGARLAVLCRALAMDKSCFTMIYLLTQRLRCPSGVATQKDLARALVAFDRAQGTDKGAYLGLCRFSQAAFLRAADRAETPGKSLPSIHSRKAPPADET